MSSPLTPPRRRLVVAAAAVSLLAGLLAGASGAAVAPVAAANPVTPAGPGLFGTSTTPPKPRRVSPSAAPTLASGFIDSTVFNGLTNPTKIRIAADGRVFIAEKSGLVLEFQSLADPNPPTVWADLSSQVDDYWDRGLLGFALSPNFVTDHTFYVQYAWDHNPVADLPGDPYPNAPTAWQDKCPSPPNGPGPTTDGCTIEGVIARITGVPSGTPLGPGQETVLVTGWCQQYPSHSNDDIWVGSDGDLYATAGEGASFSAFDYGQLGGTTNPLYTPTNPCGDPVSPGDVGTAQTLPTAEGGALRAQSARRTDGPTLLSGALIRISPTTGLGVPGNPYYASSDPNKRRILAFGLRNPFRFTFQPGKNVAWIGDVGEVTWEEIDRLTLPAADGSNDFGWPCKEGPGAHPGWPTNVNQCTSLTNAVGPYFAYNHGSSVASGDGCLTGGSSISGMTFYSGTAYPARYRGALFFTDHSRDCIWAMLPGSNGDPDPSNIVPIDVGSVTPPSCLICGVDMSPDPATGDILYADYDGGTIHRLQYGVPHAIPAADVTSGPAPLTVHFDGSGSTTSAPPLTYAWTIPAGSCNSLTSATPTCTFSQVGSSRVTLKVTDVNGVSNTSPPLTITSGDSPPMVAIDTIDGTAPPAQPTLDGNGNPPAVRPGGVPDFYAVADDITFAGHATSATLGSLPASDLTWEIRIYHCPSNCHTHLIETLPGTASGDIGAPDHPYPSLLQIRLTATDSFGLSSSASVYLYPKAATLTIDSSPAGVTIGIGPFTGTTPFSETFIQGGAAALSGPTLTTLGGSQYGFVSWSDGGAATHTLHVPTSDTTYTARYIPDSRLAGSDRYGTSAAGAATFPTGPAIAYVAGGADFADAAAAAAIAAQQHVPLLLVQPNGIPAAIATQLTRLQPHRIVVLGGEGAVSATVFAQLGAFTSPTSGQVTRAQGADRYATAADLATATFPAGVGSVYVVDGGGFADAVSTAPLAALNHAPVLYVQPDAVPASVVTALAVLKPARIVIVGGTAVVSNAVKTTLGQIQADLGITPDVERLAGTDRYATAAMVALLVAAGGPPSAVYVASGLAFPDALTAAVVAGSLGDPVLLEGSGLPLPPPTASAMATMKPLAVVVVGGPGVISDAVLIALPAASAP